MFICGRRCLSIRDEGGLATRDGTHLSPLCKIWVRNAHWTRRLGVEDRMRRLPPPQFFQRLEKTSVAACTIQQAFRRAQRSHAVNILPRTRYPPYQSYHRLHRLRASPSDVVSSSLLRPIHSTSTHMWCGDSTHRKVCHICS